MYSGMKQHTQSNSLTDKIDSPPQQLNTIDYVNQYEFYLVVRHVCHQGYNVCVYLWEQCHMD